MVKASSSGRKPRRRRGRPPIDPADLRSERYGFRLHPDLWAEMVRLARREGISVALWLERAAIDRVHRQASAEILDAIGRYKSPPEPR
jgi:predicted nuclease with RNAse H fold